jgi:hypothetical protein
MTADTFAAAVSCCIVILDEADLFVPNSASGRLLPCLRWPGRVWMKLNVLNNAVVAVLRCCTDLMSVGPGRRPPVRATVRERPASVARNAEPVVRATRCCYTYALRASPVLDGGQRPALFLRWTLPRGLRLRTVAVESPGHVGATGSSAWEDIREGPLVVERERADCDPS